MSKAGIFRCEEFNWRVQEAETNLDRLWSEVAIKFNLDKGNISAK